MQHDEVICQVIRHNHCSFMAQIETGKFCRNPYNVTGNCNRSSCPLANSCYGTIRDHDEKIMTMPRKEQKREARREEKAVLLDKGIEKEMLERLKKGVYGDIYNYLVKEYNKVLDMEALEAASEDEEEHEIEYVEGYEQLEEEEDMEDLGNFAMEETGADDDGGMDDYDSDDDKSGKRGRKDSGFSHRMLKKDEPGAKQKKKSKVLVEVEHDDTSERQSMVL